MKKAVKWTTILAPIAVLGIIVVSILSIPTLSVQASGFHGMHGGGGFSGHGFHERVVVVNHSFLFFPFLLGLLAKIVMIIAGWILWMRGKSSGVKIAGGALLGIGMLALLPTILAIPLLMLVGYLLYKGVARKETNVQELMTAEDLVVPSYTHRDFLDEWENKVRREDK